MIPRRLRHQIRAVEGRHDPLWLSLLGWSGHRQPWHARNAVLKRRRDRVLRAHGLLMRARRDAIRNTDRTHFAGYDYYLLQIRGDRP